MTVALRQIALSAHGIETLHRRRPNVPWSEAVGPEDHGKGRRCVYAHELGCITTLSRWNPGPACFCHTARYELEMEEAVCDALAA